VAPGRGQRDADAVEVRMSLRDAAKQLGRPLSNGHAPRAVLAPVQGFAAGSTRIARKGPAAPRPARVRDDPWDGEPRPYARGTHSVSRGPLARPLQFRPWGERN